jgi:hypothetical protein
VVRQRLNCALNELSTNATSGGRRALTAKAKLSGHWVDYSENKNRNVIYAISDEPAPKPRKPALTREEWVAEFCDPAIDDQRHET